MYLHVLEVSIEFSMSGYLLPLQKYHLYRGAKDKHKDPHFYGQDILGVLDAVVLTNSTFQDFDLRAAIPERHEAILDLPEMRKAIFEEELTIALEAIWNYVLDTTHSMTVNNLTMKHSHSIAAGTAVYIEKSWQ